MSSRELLETMNLNANQTIILDADRIAIQKQKSEGKNCSLSEQYPVGIKSGKRDRGRASRRKNKI